MSKKILGVFLLLIYTTTFFCSCSSSKTAVNTTNETTLTLETTEITKTDNSETSMSETTLQTTIQSITEKSETEASTVTTTDKYSEISTTISSSPSKDDINAVYDTFNLEDIWMDLPNSIDLYPHTVIPKIMLDALEIYNKISLNTNIGNISINFWYSTEGAIMAEIDCFSIIMTQPMLSFDKEKFYLTGMSNETMYQFCIDDVTLVPVFEEELDEEYWTPVNIEISETEQENVYELSRYGNLDKYTFNIDQELSKISIETPFIDSNNTLMQFLITNNKISIIRYDSNVDTKLYSDFHSNQLYKKKDGSFIIVNTRSNKVTTVDSLDSLKFQVDSFNRCYLKIIISNDTIGSEDTTYEFEDYIGYISEKNLNNNNLLQILDETFTYDELDSLLLELKQFLN